MLVIVCYVFDIFTIHSSRKVEIADVYRKTRCSFASNAFAEVAAQEDPAAAVLQEAARVEGVALGSECRWFVLWFWRFVSI